jgi:tetratricopeptide (TPR) repeat protein
MRVAVAIVVTLLAAACSTAPSSPTKSADGEPVELRALRGFEIVSLHVIPQPGLEAGTRLAAGAPLGRVQPLPETLSGRHQSAIESADARYDAEQYEEALAVIDPAYQDEPENPFVIEVYARTLYRMGRRVESFEPYRKLVALLDAQRLTIPGAGPQSVVIDAWFADAYWKLGTLYMDRAEYDKAAFEISRCLATGRSLPPALTDQAYSYLTKAHYHLGDYATAEALGRLTLRHNPDNQYVRPFLDDMRTR